MNTLFLNDQADSAELSNKFVLIKLQLLNLKKGPAKTSRAHP